MDRKTIKEAKLASQMLCYAADAKAVYVKGCSKKK
jgi:hypothetical protein